MGDSKTYSISHMICTRFPCVLFCCCFVICSYFCVIYSYKSCSFASLPPRDCQYHTSQGYPRYFREPLWKSMGLTEGHWINLYKYGQNLWVSNQKQTKNQPTNQNKTQQARPMRIILLMYRTIHSYAYAYAFTETALKVHLATGSFKWSEVLLYGLLLFGVDIHI